MPLVLGVMLLWRMAPRGAWIARWPLALIVGATAGLRLIAFLHGDFLAQIRNSIRPDAIVSFIDGRRYKTLKRHLTAHGFDPRAYRGTSLGICTVRISALHGFRLLALPQTDFSPDHPVGMRCLAVKRHDLIDACLANVDALVQRAA